MPAPTAKRSAQLPGELPAQLPGELTEEEAAQILRPYGLRLHALRPLHRGTISANYYLESDAGPAFLRLCAGKTDADMRFEARLIWHLTSHGLSTPHLWHAHYRDPYVKIRREGALLPQPAMLFEWVDGVEHLDSEIDGPRAHAVGQLLGQLHLCAADLHAEPLPGQPAGSLAQRESIYGVPQIRRRLVGLQLQPKVRSLLGPVIDELLAEATRLLSVRPRGLPSGLGHNDLFPDNLLFPRRRSRRSARHAAPLGLAEGWVLDLEQAATTPYIYDVAVALLAFCAPAPSWPALTADAPPVTSASPESPESSERPESSDPSGAAGEGAPVLVETAPRLGPLRREPARALLDGYQTMRVLSDAEWQALHGELRCAAVRFTTTRLTDVHLRPRRGQGGVQAKPPGDPAPQHSKDYRDFLWRLRRLKELSSEELLAELR